jgi:hypothetical protein
VVLSHVFLAFFRVDKIEVRPAHRQPLLQLIGGPFFDD